MPPLSARSSPTPREPAIDSVLVVDDSRSQRMLLGMLLRSWGYRVTEAESGQAALDLCQTRHFELILSDWIMPGMNGGEFCRALRGIAGERYSYFILLTSKSDANAVAEGLDVGADDFLAKPVAHEELRARIAAGARLLDMQRHLRDQNRKLSGALTELRSVYSALDRDLMQARKLQQSLVRDHRIALDGAQLALVLRPSGHVGGDMVGWFPIARDRVGFYALDVAGHGVTSALMCARLAALFTGGGDGQNIALAGAPEGRAVDPAVVADRMNRLLLTELEAEHYCTLCYAEADLTTGRVQFVQAGHPHPLVQRAGGGIEFLGTGGLPVGLIEGAQFETVAVDLAPGDRLLIYSDGITESQVADGTELGPEGLGALMEQLQTLRGNALLDALLWEMVRQSGTDEFADDVSGLMFEYFRPARPA